MKALTTWGRRALGALVCALGAGAGVPVAHAADLVVGQVAPLSGVLASTGAQIVLGGKIYFDWVNANGGVHGTPIRQDVVDDAYKVSETVRLTRDMLARPEVVALYGFAGTANITQLLADGVLAVIMIAINKPAAAFIQRYREQGGSAQLYNISVVDPSELVKLAGLKNAHGLGISQVVPYPYQPQLPVVREYQALLKKYAPQAEITYTSFEQFVGAKVLVEALRRAGPAPTRAKVIKALESLQSFDVGGITLGYSPTNRVGSRYVEVTVIGRNGRLMK